MKTENKQKSNLGKAIVTLGLSFTLFNAIKAQDNITLKNGDELKVKVIEVNETEIKYKSFDNQEGPSRIIYKSEVFLIKYQNGTKDVFNEESVKTINNNTGPVYQNNSGPVKQIILEQPKQEDKRFDNDSTDFAKTRRKRFGGPRIGATFIGPGLSADYLSGAGKQPFITQFGWQFEGRLFTTDNGTQGLIEFVPLIGGIEQGLFIPSASVLLGIRGGKQNVYEFGIGPNFTVTKNYRGGSVGSVGVVIAAGTSLKSANIYFPITLAFVPSVGSSVKNEDPDTGLYNKDLDKTFLNKQKVQTSFKLSLLVGFNYRKK